MKPNRRLAPALAAVLAAAAPGALRCDAQEAALPAPITVTVEHDRDLRADAAIILSLSRPLAADEGELALFVGGVDVTAVSVRTSSRIVYRPAAIQLPDGETEIVVYRRSARAWTELRRFTARVQQAVGASARAIDKSATLGNTGQLAQGQSDGLPSPGRRTFQDFVLNGGLHGSREGSGWSFTGQSNYIGVTRREQALRFTTRGQAAPMFDLSDYALSASASSFRASVGHITFGDSRHLVSGLAARGAAVSFDHGPTSLRVGAFSGSAEVGWSNLVGLERPKNRVYGASIGQEMFAAHPGSLRLDLTLLDGSRSPTTSFTQSAVVDAQRSAGSSLQLTAALPNQRLRAVAGYSRSRFENPANDPQLRSDSITRRPTPVTRGARFVEVSGVVLENAHILGAPASMTLGFHDERVDPLYGSVAATVAADRRQDVADATLSWRGISAQLTEGVGRDNLGRVASILTTNNRVAGANFAVPVAALAHSGAVWLPTLTAVLNQTHQVADAAPTNGQFRPTDLPDQLSSSGDLAATWQVGRYRWSAHASRAAQDNRQALREHADFDGGVRALSLGTSLGSRGDVSLDLGDEYLLAKERDERTYTRRVTFNSSLTPRSGTGVVAALSLLHTRPPSGVATVNTEQRLELSQAVSLRPSSGDQRGQAFLRYARTTSLLPDPALAGVNPFVRALRQRWSLASGLNMRLF